MSERMLLAGPDPERVHVDRVHAREGTPGILTVAGPGFDLSRAQSVNLFPPTAWGYEPVWRSRSIAILTGGAFSTRRELETMRAWIALAPNESVLDAGCSAGLYARTLKHAEPTADVHAVDVSVPFLREALHAAHRDDMRLSLLHADVEELPYRDAAFDAIVSGGSLNEFRHPAGALDELARVLRPGGRLFLMFTARSETPIGRTVQDVLARAGLSFPTPADVDGWAESAGLASVRAELHRPIALALYRKPGTTGA